MLFWLLVPNRIAELHENEVAAGIPDHSQAALDEPGWQNFEN